MSPGAQPYLLRVKPPENHFFFLSCTACHVLGLDDEASGRRGCKNALNSLAIGALRRRWRRGPEPVFHREQRGSGGLDVACRSLMASRFCRASCGLNPSFRSISIASYAITERCLPRSRSRRTPPQTVQPQELEARNFNDPAPGRAGGSATTSPATFRCQASCVGRSEWDTNRRQVTRAGERIGLTYTNSACEDLSAARPCVVPPLDPRAGSGLPTTSAPPTCAFDVYVPACRGKLARIPATPSYPHRLGNRLFYHGR